VHVAGAARARLAHHKSSMTGYTCLFTVTDRISGASGADLAVVRARACQLTRSSLELIEDLCRQRRRFCITMAAKKQVREAFAMYVECIQCAMHCGSVRNLVCAVQKRAQESINSRLALVMKSGKYTLGYKTTLKTLRSGKGALQTFGLLVPCPFTVIQGSLQGAQRRLCTAAAVDNSVWVCFMVTETKRHAVVFMRRESSAAVAHSTFMYIQMIDQS
jgi:hypothetical protein